MENPMVVKAYLIYLPIVLGLTFFVSRNLFRNGRVFMLDIFHGKQDIAFSTNRLFEMGFYLINMGYALLMLKISYSEWEPFESNVDLIETLSVKIGGFSIYLGVMLFLNMYLFFRGRKKSREHGKNGGEQVKLDQPAVS